MRKKDAKKKNERTPIEDDGRTIANMNVDGLPWYRPNATRKKEGEQRDQPTHKETLALIFAAYKAHLPYFIAMIVGFGLAFLIVALWING